MLILDLDDNVFFGCCFFFSTKHTHSQKKKRTISMALKKIIIIRKASISVTSSLYFLQRGFFWSTPFFFCYLSKSARVLLSPDCRAETPSKAVNHEFITLVSIFGACSPSKGGVIKARRSFPLCGTAEPRSRSAFTRPRVCSEYCAT